MKFAIVTSALILASLSAKAQVDVTTCNSDLFKKLSEVTNLTESIRPEVELAALIQGSKINELNRVIKVQEQLLPLLRQAQMSASKVTGGFNNGLMRSESGGKLQASTLVLSVLRAQRDSLNKCFNRAEQLLNVKGLLATLDQKSETDITYIVGVPTAEERALIEQVSIMHYHKALTIQDIVKKLEANQAKDDQTYVKMIGSKIHPQYKDQALATIDGKKDNLSSDIIALKQAAIKYMDSYNGARAMLERK